MVGFRRISPDNRRMSRKLFFKLKGWTWLDKAIRPSIAPLNRGDLRNGIGLSRLRAGRQHSRPRSQPPGLQPAHPAPPPRPRTPDPIPQHVKEPAPAITPEPRLQRDQPSTMTKYIYLCLVCKSKLEINQLYFFGRFAGKTTRPPGCGPLSRLSGRSLPDIHLGRSAEPCSARRVACMTACRAHLRGCHQTFCIKSDNWTFKATAIRRRASTETFSSPRSMSPM
jgi:hypothetical protein